MVIAAFVAPYLMEATSRFALSAARLPGVRLAVITTESTDRLSPELKEALAGHWRVDNALDPQQIADAIRGLSGQIGRVERLVGALEQLQVPLGEVRDALGIEGMGAAVAANVRDKARMKTVLAAAGVPCARHRRITHTEEALSFRDLVGYPIVAKPPDGAGAKATFRLDSDADFDSWLTLARRDPAEIWLLEEFLTGREHSFDSVTMGGETIWASISDYQPPPLEVLRTPWVQWTVMLPRDISGPEYAQIHRAGPAALKALGVTHAFSHMEWFERPDGSVAISEAGARPPGAQIATMLGFAHDMDFHSVWAELMINDTFTPRERRFAAGTAYLRGMGRGQVRAVHGIDRLQAEIGHLVVDSKLPRPGQWASGTYEGEGFITVRHPETAVVADALHRIISTARIELIEGQ